MPSRLLRRHKVATTLTGRKRSTKCCGGAQYFLWLSNRSRHERTELSFEELLKRNSFRLAVFAICWRILLRLLTTETAISLSLVDTSKAIGTNKLPARQVNGSSYIVRAASRRLILFGWEAGTRTPIARSRVWSPTIGRPPSKRNLNLRIGAALVN